MLLGAGALAEPLASLAQKPPAKIYRIGVLIPGTAASTVDRQDAFMQGLRQQGYVEGQNIILERRYGDGNVERLRDLAAELVRSKVDVKPDAPLIETVRGVGYRMIKPGEE